MPRTFQEISIANKTRQQHWHADTKAVNEWSVVDWSNALAGEVGEVCNAVKKYRRVQTGTKDISDPGRQITDLQDLRQKVGEEIADTYIYLDLLAQHLGLDVEQEVVKKFNSTSDRYGFPTRL